ncbi:MAG: HEAT repeat domain-containing protein [Verrucomicrobia bacterium]|nr:HEAT repeat domain-containing protein [Verrucomicrobiota bacterium]
MKKTSKRDWKTPAILIGLVVVAIVFFFQRPKEPIFEGRTLSKWMADLDDTASDAQRIAARKAIQQMGTNIVPNLLRMLSPQAALSRRQMAGAEDQAKTEHWRAVLAFQELRPVAIPILADLLDGESGTTVARALSPMGPEAITALLKALTNKDPVVRERVELGLELDSTNSASLRPVLLANLKDPNDRVRAYAARALARDTAVSENVLSGLIEALQDPSDDVRLQTLEALSHFGTNATPAILPLLEVAKTASGKISRAAYSALAQIAPEAAERAGVR